MTLNVFRVARACATALILMLGCCLLAACGGGGGGGSGGGDGSSDQDPQSQIPTSLSFSIEEGPHANPQRKFATFQFYAPTTELPSAPQLTGADGIPFTVFLSASDANASGYRTIQIEVYTSDVFNFEDPQDANKDNIYSFVFSVVYRGKTLSTTLNVTITDIADNIEVRSVILEGEAVDQFFGVEVIAIPDVTGDGKPEIGTHMIAGRGPASAYIITSEFYNSIPAGKLGIDTLGDKGTRFEQSPAATAQINRYTAVANRISALEKASGSGTQILLSDAARKKAFLFEINSPSDYQSLRGSIDPDNIPNAITYTFTGPNSSEARLVGDVNGDGQNDILVMRFSQTGNLPVTYGIIFGRAATSQSDRQRTDAFDIILDGENQGEGIPHIFTKMVSDITGDGLPDLFISAPMTYDRYPDNTISQGLVYLIKSSLLHAMTPASTSLIHGPITETIRFFPSSLHEITELEDSDSDGTRTLFMHMGGEGRLVDGNDVGNPLGSNALISDPPSRLVPNAGGPRSLAADYDGDDIADFIFFGVIRGARVKQGLAPYSGQDPEIAGSLSINLEKALPYESPQRWSTVHLGAAEMVAFSGASADGPLKHETSFEKTAGRIVLVTDADIRRGVTTTGSQELIVH